MNVLSIRTENDKVFFWELWDYYSLITVLVRECVPNLYVFEVVLEHLAVTRCFYYRRFKGVYSSTHF